MAVTSIWGLSAGWGLAKAIAIALALSLVAVRAQSTAMGALALLFLLIGVEDQISVHGWLGGPISRLLRFEDWVPGIAGKGSRILGEFGALLVFGVIGFLLVWTRKQPVQPALRRARVVFSLLLVVMFFFAGVVDAVTAAQPSLAAILQEETGEMVILTIGLGYSAALASIRVGSPTANPPVSVLTTRHGAGDCPQNVLDTDDSQQFAVLHHWQMAIAGFEEPFSCFSNLDFRREHIRVVCHPISNDLDDRVCSGGSRPQDIPLGNDAAQLASFYHADRANLGRQHHLCELAKGRLWTAHLCTAAHHPSEFQRVPPGE